MFQSTIMIGQERKVLRHLLGKKIWMIIDALQSRLDFFYEKGIVELQTEMENMYFCVLLDRLYKCYLYGIKTDRVRKIIYDTNEKYFL